MEEPEEIPLGLEPEEARKLFISTSFRFSKYNYSRLKPLVIDKPEPPETNIVDKRKKEKKSDNKNSLF